MTKPIKNIIIFSMHRSGSTYLNARAAYGLGLYYGMESKEDTTVRNLGELTGWAPYTTYNNRLTERGEVRDVEKHGGNYVSEMPSWKLEDGILRRSRRKGTVISEIETRESILNSSAWNNHVVIRIQPWTWLEMLDRLSNAALVPDAHYVVLWRRDFFSWLTSWFIIGRTMRHHGEIMFDGYRYHSRFSVQELIDARVSYIGSFLRTIEKLSNKKDRVSIIETSNIDKHSKLEWGDGNSLDLPGKDLIPKTGQISYVDKDGNSISKEQMIKPGTLAKLRQVSRVMTERYDWDNAVYNAIYK